MCDCTGGGAGSAINVTLNNLAPGATYTLVVGAGGAGGQFSSIGQPGGSVGATSLAGYSAPGGAIAAAYVAIKQLPEWAGATDV